MKQIPLFGLGVQSKSSNVTAQNRINLYLENSVDSDKTSVSAYAMPGLDLFLEFGAAKVRGMYVVGDYLYVVNKENFWKVANNGTMTLIGTLDSAIGRVEITDNGSQIFIATGVSGYIYNLTTLALTKIVSGYVGGNCAQFNDGYFIAVKPNSMQFSISKSYDGLVWDALDFASSESNPDNLITCVVDHGEAIMFGDVSTEFWSNSGAIDFPYSPLGAAIEWGLAARWSIAKFDNSVMYLAKNRMGEVQVVKLNGYTPQRVSTADIEAIFNGYTATSDATALTYLSNGHPFYQISFPTQGVTWSYDGASDCWSQLISPLLTRHRAEIAVSWLGRIIVSDYANGNVYAVNKNSYYDNGVAMVCELISKHISANLSTQSINAVQVDMEGGVGGDEPNPQISLSVSRDGGHTWGAEQFRDMGKIGRYKTSARWSRLGNSRDFVFKIRMSDPVKKVILGAYAE